MSNVPLDGQLSQVIFQRFGAAERAARLHLLEVALCVLIFPHSSSV